jgi:hypothetical protein
VDENDYVFDCCPSVLEMVEPQGGKNQEDMFVELYSDGENRQRYASSFDHTHSRF